MDQVSLKILFGNQPVYILNCFPSDRYVTTLAKNLRDSQMLEIRISTGAGVKPMPYQRFGVHDSQWANHESQHKPRYFQECIHNSYRFVKRFITDNVFGPRWDDNGS